MANLWQYKGHVEQAMDGYREAVALEPTYVPAQLELGRLLVEHGQLDQAILHYQKAIEANPERDFFKEKLQDLFQRAHGDRQLDLPNWKVPVPGISTDPNHKGKLLWYTDCSGINGAEQCNHLLISHFTQMGFRSTFVQSRAFHHLTQERTKAGIEQIWIQPDDLYSEKVFPRAFSNHSEAEHIFLRTKPDFIVFSDGCPFSNLAAKQVAARLGIPFMIIVHCVTAQWAKRFARHAIALKTIYQEAEAVIAVSHENLSLLHEFFFLPSGRGEVIYNGVPQHFFQDLSPATKDQLRKELGIPSQGVLCMTVARMEQVKGYQYQLKAIEILRHRRIWPSVVFVWVGTGSLEPRLRAWVENLGIQNHIKFLGERKDIPDLLSTADIFILPSLFEGMPLSIMEAMAKGIPVVSSSISGVPEELGPTGKLLPDPNVDPQGTVYGLADTIQAWVQNPDVRMHIGNEGKRRAGHLFKADRMIQSYVQRIHTLWPHRQSTGPDNGS